MCVLLSHVRRHCPSGCPDRFWGGGIPFWASHDYSPATTATTTTTASPCPIVLLRKWTEEEDTALQKGVKTFGGGKWMDILQNYPALSARDNVSLKDRWRTLQAAKVRVSSTHIL